MQCLYYRIHSVIYNEYTCVVCTRSCIMHICMIEFHHMHQFVYDERAMGVMRTAVSQTTLIDIELVCRHPPGRLASWLKAKSCRCCIHHSNMQI